MVHANAYFDIVQWLPEQAAAAFFEAGRSRRLPAGGTLYVQGEPGEQMFRIVAGSVRLAVFSANGREVIFQLFGAGDCFGNSSVIDGGPRPQTAVAQTDCELQVFARSAIDALRGRHPVISDALLRLTSRQSRLLSSYFAQSSLDEVAARVAQRLVAAVDRFGIEENGKPVVPRYSQSELALMVGTARQTVNKALRRFQVAGLITVDRRNLVVLDLPRLRAAADGCAVKNEP